MPHYLSSVAVSIASIRMLKLLPQLLDDVLEPPANGSKFYSPLILLGSIPFYLNLQVFRR